MDAKDANDFERQSSKMVAGNNASLGAEVGGPEIWKRVCVRLASEIDPAEFHKWIASLRFISEVDGSVLIVAKTRFAFDRVNAHYFRQIEKAWARLDPKERPVQFECWSSVSSDIRALLKDPWADEARVLRIVEAEPEPQDADTLLSGPAPMRFDTFVTGASNDVATTVARSIAHNRQQVAASLFVVNGLQGVGKTHLMKAIEVALLDRNDCRVAYISAEEFLVAYVDGAKVGDTRALKARVRGADVVLFDDLQRIAGKKGTNEELAGTIRTVTNRGGIVVLTADRAPAEMEGLSHGVMTMLKGAACIEITMPDTEMRLQIVRQRAKLLSQSSPKFVLGDDMCEAIVSRVHGPGRDLCGAVVSLYTETGLGAVAPTGDMLDRVLARQQKPKLVSLDMIKRAVCKAFDMTRADLVGGRKYQRCVRARQIGMFLAREMTDKSYPQIGIAFGNRHHTTALYAWRKITKKIASTPDLTADIERVKQLIAHFQTVANS